MRALADVILLGVRQPRIGRARAARLGLSPEAFAALVERFVDGGVAAIAEHPPFPSWLQLGLSFAPPRGRRAALLARARFGEALRRAVLGWQERGLAGRFFFMNKPPGMRVRIETTSVPDTVRAVTRWSARRPFVAKLERTVYLPEEYQFGGHAGASVAHDYHSADSLLALHAQYRDQTDRASASLEILSLLAVTDLVRRMTDDSWEAWDLWKRMELTGRLPRVRHERADELAERVRPFVLAPDAVLRRISRADRALVEAAYENNARCATAMRRLADAGELLFHLREIIPFWVIFHWNRWGIVDQRALAIGVERVLSPKESR